MADPLERITNLLALLLEARRPLTLAEIADELAGQYPDNEVSRRAAFERDKALLRAEGVPIEQEVLGGERAGQTAYRIDRRRYELGDLGLTDEERSALQLAVATVRLGTAWGEQAIWKLGGEGVETPHDVSASLPSLPAVADLFAASSARAPVRFTYRGQARLVDPYALVSREGFWYVVGHDHDRRSMRTFRVDRIDGQVKAGEPGSFERPVGFDVRSVFPEDPKLLGDAGSTEPATATVLVDSARAAAVVAELGDGAVQERRPDGAVVVVVPARSELAFRSWVLGLGEHAEVLGPPEVRASVVAWLEALVAARERAGADGGRH